MDARRARLILIYNNKDITDNLEKYLISFSYTDHSNGKADDLQITLEDRESLWQTEWFPEKSAAIYGNLVTYNWETDEEISALPLGMFEIDEVATDGPPEVVKIKATSVPVTGALRGEKKTRAWEKTRLKNVANDIAKNSRLKLFYDTYDNPEYDRIEQTEQSDLSFLQNLCENAGLSLKVTGQQLVIFDDSKYEKMPHVMRIIKGVSPVISYSATSQTRDVYSACRVEYQGGSTQGNIRYTYVPPNRPQTGKTLVINERVSSIADAQRLAKKRLRQKNQEEVKFSLTMLGNTNLVSGVTVLIEGWGIFSGKYFIEETSHSGGSGYTTKLELRKVLEGY